jgi:protein TonB
MSRTYALYFDRRPVNVERRAKQAVVIGVVALHLLVILWALRTHPHIARSAESLVVVQLNALSNVVFADRSKRDITPKQVSHTPAVSRQKPLNHPLDDVPAGGINRPLVAEAHERAGTSDTSLPDSGALSANMNAVVGAVPAHASGGTGSIFGAFRPPQVIHRARMNYPKAAIAAEAQGDVDVLVTIGADGTLRDASIDRSSGNADLDEASLQLIRAYQFKAAEKNGIATEAQAIINLTWRIGARERYEFAHSSGGHRTIDLDAQMKALDFFQSMPTRRQACDHMKNPDCLATPTDD